MSNNQNPEKQISTRDLLNSFFRQKLKILTFFVLTIIFVALGLYVWPQKYTAEATLLVKLGRENSSVPSVLTGSQQVLSFGVTKEQVNSEIEIINNNFLVEKTVNELGLDYLFPDSPKPETLLKLVKYYAVKAVNKVKDTFYNSLYAIGLLKKLSDHDAAVYLIQKSLDVSSVKYSNVIKIELMWGNPVIASTVVNTLIRFYMDYRTELYKTPGVLELFKSESVNLKDQLSIRERELQKFRKEWGIISTENQKKTIVERISKLKTSLQENMGDIYKSEKEVEELKSQISDSLPVENRGNDDVTATDNNSLLNPTFPIIIPKLEDKLLDAQVRLAALKEKGRAIEDELKSSEEEFKKIGDKEIELLRIKRNLNITENNYRLYLKKLEESRISKVMDSAKIANVRVISYSYPPYKPTKPRKKLVLIIGALMGLFGGIALAFYSEYLDHSIKNVEDVENYLNLPVITSIREVKRKYRF